MFTHYGIMDYNNFWLSKSTYLKGLQCQKSLYLNKYRAELKEAFSDNQKALFKSGNDVGELAQTLFPDGENMTSEKPFDYKGNYQKTISRLNNGAKVLYEAVFMHHGVYVAADILTVDEEGIKVYEVKSATMIKGVYVQDAALQYYIMGKCDVTPVDFYVMHINNKYRRKGDLEIDKLFRIKSILPAILEQQDELADRLNTSFITLKNKEKEPQVAIGAHCDTPYGCDFKKYCWGDIPNNSILNLCEANGKQWELYNAGIKTFDELPKDEELTENQKLQIKAHSTNKPIVKKVPLAEFLAELHYPLSFLDFETFSYAIPPFEKSKAFEQIPFQYSLHVQGKLNGEIRHKEFLASEIILDTRVAFMESLKSQLPELGTILAYSADYELQMLKNIVYYFPEYKDFVENIRKRTVDLAIPFEKKWIYFASFNGKYSIKVVLPAMVEESSYDDLEIQNGETAALTYKLLRDGNFKGDKMQLKENLKTYCKLDTWAMVKILEKMKKF